MKQIIVDVSDLTIEEKQRVNEALAKIKNIVMCTPMFWDKVTVLYGPSFDAINVGFDLHKNSSQTHTPQQILEMAGMVEKRGVHKDFDSTKKYIVDVSGCSEEEKKKVQQAFFDVGILWFCKGKSYQHLHAAAYTNTLLSGQIMGDLMFGFTAKRCNMAAEEFLELVYEPEKQGHVHAELMAQYAEDAKTHAEPWKLWQVKYPGGIWKDCKGTPTWGPAKEFRRKPKKKTHIVNGVEIPDLRIKVFNEETQDGDCIGYCVDPLDVELYTEHYLMIPRFLELGILYEHTEEGKQAAILHAKAWLGIAEQ